jgi:hypothetical protein
LETDSLFNGYETLTYNQNPSNFLSSFMEPANSVFNIMVGGTTNMTSTYNAPVFVSNGNFFGIDSNAQSSLPTDINGMPFPSDQASSSSFFVIDELSGTTMQMQSSL